VWEEDAELLNPLNAGGETVYLYTSARTPRMAGTRSEQNASVAVKPPSFDIGLAGLYRLLPVDERWPVQILPHNPDVG